MKCSSAETHYCHKRAFQRKSNNKTSTCYFTHVSFINVLWLSVAKYQTVPSWCMAVLDGGSHLVFCQPCFSKWLKTCTTFFVVFIVFAINVDLIPALFLVVVSVKLRILAPWFSNEIQSVCDRELHPCQILAIWSLEQDLLISWHAKMDWGCVTRLNL